MYVLLLLDGVFYRCCLDLVCRVFQVFYFHADLFSSSFLFSIIESVVLKSTIVKMNYLFFSVLSVFNTFWGLLLGVDMFIILVSSWWFDPFIFIKCLLCLQQQFSLEIYFSDISISTQVSLVIMYIVYLFYSFTYKLFVSFTFNLFLYYGI